MEKNTQALNYIINCIKELDKNFLVKVKDVPYIYFFGITFNNKHYQLKFYESLIEDFEIALERYKNSDYFYSLESTIKFTIYINLGGEGLLKNFSISNELLNERREWVKDYRIDTVFNKQLTKILYDGLIKINDFFNSLLKDKSLDLVEIKEDREWVQDLIQYYDKDHNLNSTGAGMRNLQYLKAAAVQQIFELEYRKKSEKMTTIKKAIDKKIYTVILPQLRKDPFLDIELPEFIQDLKTIYE